jgi:hypothetical protein
VPSVANRASIASMAESVYVVTRAQMERFGVIVQWFARHETLIQLTISGVSGADFVNVVALTLGLGYSGKRDALLSLLRLSPPSESHVERIRWFAGELHKHSQLRNSIAHHTWLEGARPDSIKPIYLMRGRQGTVVGILDDEP